MDPVIKARIAGAMINHDRKLCEAEARKGHRVNMFRLGILLRGVDSIEETYDGNGQDLRRAILRHTCGRVASAVLKACGLPTLTLEEARS